ncbi:MAG: hypothetical protein VR72_02830 [Clostridiaceae bacterium BRH_c20a]|nr:MAG: hypothetical protein VR72_02830 [Clostridiaceae bacterium BRH_c20a]
MRCSIVDNKLYELIEKMYIDMQEMKANMATKDDFQELKGDIRRLEQNLARIEYNHGEKLQALFDGYMQNSQKLDRIEQEVQKHEEFIIKRVK